MTAALHDAWLAGPEGRLCGREQAKAWALREVWLAEGKPRHGMPAFVAERVRKTASGKPGREAPTSAAMREFFQKVDEDKGWFPGKRSQKRYGPEPVLSGAKRRAVAKSAMRMKAAGREPTYKRVIADNREATLNPSTGDPLSKERIYDVFTHDCYDEDPERGYLGYVVGSQTGYVSCSGFNSNWI